MDQACSFCREKGLTAEECRERLRQDEYLFNNSHVHLTLKKPPSQLTREDVHALADILRLLK